MSNKLNLVITQGKTFLKVFRWETDEKVYKSISNITNAAPCIITSTSHGIPNDWRYRVSNVVGMTELNTLDYSYISKVVYVDTLELNNINSIDYKTYVTNTGVIEFNKPVDITGYTARMQLRESIDSVDVVLELTTENGGIIIDAINYTISLFISALDTSLLSFNKCKYDLELVKDTVVTTLVSGTVSLSKEVTR